MKEVFVERLNESQACFDMKFEDDVTIDNSFMGKTIISDDAGHCLIIRDMDMLSIQVSPVVQVDEKKLPFDCAGSCQGKCCECNTRQEQIEEED